MALEPQAIERFQADLDALIAADVRLGLAVSGGPDSLAMLLLAHQARPGRIAAATVDHGLRADSAVEAAEVERLCQRLGIPHATLEIEWSEPPGPNLQARARAARYDALGRWAAAEGLAAVATAHHADDQAETLLMRIAWGAGVGGLASIQRSRPLGPGPVRLIRPLLDWRRAELSELVAAAGIAPADDPANRDSRFDRTRARALLTATDWLDPRRLAAAAACCADADAALDWAATREFAARHRRDGEALLLDPAGLPRELKHRLLHAAFAALGAPPPPGPKLSRAIAILDRGGTTTLAGLRLAGGGRWRLAPAPPRGS